MTDNTNALLSALDAGDDSVLPILADVLEEMGDPRAAGLRLFAHRPAAEEACRPVSYGGGTVYHWLGCSAEGGTVTPGHEEHGVLATQAFARLERESDCLSVAYPTRSSAFLALAEALASQG